MRHVFFLIMLMMSVVGLVAHVAAEAAKGTDMASSRAQSQSTRTADEKAVRASAAEFVTAFNKGDARAMGALWCANCEYFDETGQILRGRDSIEKAYSALFSANPGLTMEISITSLRIMGGHVAIEDGTAVVKTAKGEPVSRGSYSAIHMKDGDRWLIASVRERAASSLSKLATLKDIEWLIGEWVAAKGSKELEFSFNWIADKKFLELSYTARDEGGVARSGVQIIGSDPLSGAIVSWAFDSTGGHGRGYWRILKKGIMIESRGTMADGMPTAATEMVSKSAADSISWVSFNRSVAGQSLRDTETVVLKRKSK